MLIYDYMVERWTISQFLSQYQAKTTKAQYKGYLRSFFFAIYPELKNVSKNDQDRKLDELSLQYVSSPRDYRTDLLRFRDINNEDAPKTAMVRFAAITRYLQDNDITFSRNFTRLLIGKADEAITEEHVPTSEEISKILEHMPLGARTLTLVLSSSGMRLGEALAVSLDNLELDRTPARFNLQYQTTKTKRKRFVFISSEAKRLLEEWLEYRLDYLR